MGWFPIEHAPRDGRLALVFRDVVSVLDPFMGVGTTGVACANLGRRFIGIEAAQAQQRLFA